MQFSFEDPANKESIKSLGPDGYVLAQRGIINKEKFYIPQDQLQRYDDSVLRFRISKYEITNKYMSDKPPPPPPPLSFTKEVRSRIQLSTEVEPEQETKVPLTYEKLEVFEELWQSQDIITKEPIKETKTVHVPLTYEDITIETRPPSVDTQTQTPITSIENITILVKKDVNKVAKMPYVKDEAIIKK